MFDHLLTEQQRRVRDDAREFVKATPRQLILDMDQDKVRFPREWLRGRGGAICWAFATRASGAAEGWSG